MVPIAHSAKHVMTQSAPCKTARNRDLPIDRCSAGELEYLFDNAGEFLVIRFSTVHQPEKQILVLALHESLEMASLVCAELRIARSDKRFQHQIELEHAAPRRPTHPIEFFL